MIFFKKKTFFILFFIIFFISTIFIINFDFSKNKKIVCRINNKVTQYNKRLFNYSTLSIFRKYCYDFAHDYPNKEQNNINTRQKKILDLDDPNYFIKEFKNENNLKWLSSHKDLSSNKYIYIENLNNVRLSDPKIYAEINLDREKNLKNNIEVSPIFFENLMLFVDLKNNLKAFDLETKKILWNLNFDHSIARRNLQIINYNNNNVILFSSSKGVYFVNLQSGQIVDKIGNDNSKIPPIISEDSLVVFAVNSKVKKYDLNTKKIIWELKLRKDDFLSGASPWGGVSFSKKYNRAFVSVGSPRSLNDFIGINRPGDNLYSNSVVAINLKTGKIDWWFQDTAHDLWDLDISFPPILKTIQINDLFYEAVIVVSKSGNVFLLHQKNGMNLYDYNLIKVPNSEIFGEKVSPFQIETVKPPVLINQEIKKKDLANYDKNIYSEILTNYQKMFSGNYLPPKINKDTVTIGISGGAQWFGGAVDNKDNLYVIINYLPWLNRIDTKQLGGDGIKSKGKELYLKLCSSCHGVNKSKIIERNNYIVQPSIAGEGFYRLNSYEKYLTKLKNHKGINIDRFDAEQLISYLIKSDKKMHKKKKIILEPRTRYFLDSYNNLATKAPWSKLFAIDLKTGSILWSRPAGNQEYNLSNGKKIIVEGSENWAGLSVINDVVIVSGSFDEKIYFYDTKSGMELKSLKLDGVGSASPSIHYFNKSIFTAYVLTGGGRKYGEDAKLIVTKQ